MEREGKFIEAIYHIPYTETIHILNNFTRSFTPVGPSRFREGDIVEVQVSFIVVPTKNRSFSMNVVLRSIALLNEVFSQVSA